MYLVIAGVLLGAHVLVGAAAHQEPQKLPPPRVGGQIRAPQKTKDMKPVYPPEARRAHVEGVVIIEATISPTGTVQDAKVIRSIPMLDAAALDAVRQWEFTPTLVNGVPSAVKLTLTVAFWLKVTVSEATGPDGGRHVFEITADRADRLPRWDQSLTLDPPLSANDARRAGERWLKLRNPHVKRFELVSLSLLQSVSGAASVQCGGAPGCWHYRLSFEPMDGERHLPRRPNYIAIVLLDGTIVEPRIERAGAPLREIGLLDSRHIRPTIAGFAFAGLHEAQKMSHRVENGVDFAQRGAVVRQISCSVRPCSPENSDAATMRPSSTTAPRLRYASSGNTCSRRPTWRIPSAS